MTDKRFVFEQNGNYHTVIDTVMKQPLIMLEFKENEFGPYACFHKIIDMLNNFYEEQEKLKERINRQCETIKKRDQQIDNCIDIKAKLNAKITEYENKSEEYELCACGCGAKHNWIKKTALEEFKDEIYDN